jgi:class 3 adenylate cyclase
MPEELLELESQRRSGRPGTFEVNGTYWPTNGWFTYRELLGDSVSGYQRMAELQLRTYMEEAPEYRLHYLARAVVAKKPWSAPAAATEEFGAWKTAWNNGASFGLFHRLESFSLASLFLSHLGDNGFWGGVWEDVREWKNLCAPMSGLSVDPSRGLLALRLDLIDDAERAFREGLEWSERECCPVELGRNLQGLAGVAERRGDVPAALAFLDRAAAQYQPRGVKLFLDEVINAKVRLQGINESHSSILSVSNAVANDRPDITAHAAPDGTVTLMFSDIEGSTALNDQLGDARWMELLRQHNAVLDAAIQAHGGRTVKTLGDGYMVVFASPEAAVRCALAVQEKFNGQRNQDSAGAVLLRVRIGIHTGQAVRDRGDFFGREVNFAARIANAALGGEVVVSEAVKSRLPAEHAVGEPVHMELKGFAGTHPLYRVEG